MSDDTEVRLVLLRSVAVAEATLVFRAVQIAPDRVRLSVTADSPVRGWFGAAAGAHRNQILKLLRDRFAYIEVCPPSPNPIEGDQMSITPKKVSLKPLLKRTPTPADAPLERLDDSKGARALLKSIYRRGGEPLRKANK